MSATARDLGIGEFRMTQGRLTSTLTTWIKQRDAVTSAFILVLTLGGGAIYALVRNPIIPAGGPPVTFTQQCAHALPQSSAASQAVKVSDTAATLNIFIGRDGIGRVRQSAPLAIQKGSLCPGETLTASIGDLVRADGASLPPSQVAAWGRVDNTGTHVTMYVSVAPRYGQVSGFGNYSGVVTLADPRAAGANVLVNVNILYPSIGIVLIFSLIAAFGGFTWAWLVHDLHYSSGRGSSSSGRDSYSDEYFWRNFILRIAVILATAIPVFNVQVLANPAWEGTFSQYIALATLTGAAAIALTPTLRALALPHNLPENPLHLPAPNNPSHAGDSTKE